MAILMTESDYAALRMMVEGDDFELDEVRNEALAILNRAMRSPEDEKSVYKVVYKDGDDLKFSLFRSFDQAIDDIRKRYDATGQICTVEVLS